MKNATEYNVEIETWSGSVFEFNISFTEAEADALEALIDSKNGSFIDSGYGTISIELDRYTTGSLLYQWADDDRMTFGNFHYCRDCADFAPDASPCCSSNDEGLYEDGEF